MSLYLSAGSKRFLDLFFTLLIAPFALIAFLMAVILVYFTSKGPVFFIQERIGWHGKPFKMVKIRTLSRGFSSDPGAQHGAGDITLVGRLLRKTRIDEIPQILTILKGEMSWVGPRPEVAFYYERFQ
jgi:lipopolysaccharide/colanic/teichoic acid biosynthesis glycosyltransferase